LVEEDGGFAIFIVNFAIFAAALLEVFAF